VNFPQHYFSDKISKGLMTIKKVELRYGKNFSKQLEWENVIMQTKTNFHFLLVTGKFGRKDNDISHVIGINLIHGVMFDSAEERGPALKLNVRALQDTLLPFPEKVLGITLRESYLEECVQSKIF
jgi:hypothetical protein